MDSRKILTQHRLQQWAQIIREQKNSGLTVKAYCKNAGIRIRAYYYWFPKVRDAACEQLIKHQSESAVSAHAKVSTTGLYRGQSTRCT